MSDLKKVIEQDIDQIIPNGYYENIRSEVMKSIQAPKKSFQVSFSEKKDNIILFFTVIFCVCLIYFFGYSEQYRIRILIPKDLIFKLLITSIACMTVLIFLINNYFDRKKKIFI
jgi:hypothetical protein